MVTLWFSILVWLGLLLFGARLWLTCQESGGKIGDSVVNLFLGFWIPATFFAWGLFSLLGSRTWLFDRMLRPWEIAGGAAIAVGTTWICAAFCFHCFVVWRKHRTLSRYADLVTFAFAIAGLGGLAVALLSVVL